MKMKPAVAVIGAAAVAVSMAGCSGNNASTQSTTASQLTVMVTNSPSATALQAIAPAYEKKTGTKIDFVTVSGDQLATKLVLSGKSKTATFDIAQFDQPQLASIVPAHALLPLDKYLTSDKTYDFSDFQKPLQEYTQIDGTSYGIPLSTEPYVNFYRTDLFDQAGLKAPTTWSEVDAAAKAISAAGGYGFDGPYGPTLDSGPEYFERLLENGGRLLDPKSGEPLLDSKLAIDVMKDTIDLAKYSPPSTLAGTAGDSATAFTQQNVGQNIQPSGWYGTLDDPKSSKAVGKIGVAPVPSATVGPYQPANILKGWVIGINANTQHAAAAWNFLSFALGKDNVQKFIDAGAPVPGRTSTLQSTKYNGELPYLKYLLPSIQSGTTLPVIPELTQITVDVCQAMSKMANQGADVSSTMKSLNEQVKQLLVQDGRIKQ
ncbi:sugar ABC transporter substrate-binding protein [Microbacterium sp. X-17]|uniref:ABC transporter substrate-binding protein n=1 Tax=Microbacterium sp. X-17 TaxID=3144404 RepID=UPI0031F52CB6